MLQQLNRLALPAAISIASFDATFFVAAEIFGLTDREVFSAWLLEPLAD